jgi:hypothetical protein
MSPVALARSSGIVALACLLSLLNYILRIVRWRAYPARLGHLVGLRFAALTFTAGFAYTGERVRASHYAPIGIPIRNTTATFFVERLMDLVAVIVLGALLVTVSSGYAGAVITAGFVVSGAFVALTVTPWAQLATHLRASHRILQKLQRAAAGVAFALAHTRTLLHPSVAVTGFLLGLLAWGLEGTGLCVLCSMSPRGHVDLPTALGIYGIAVPLSDAVLVTLTCRLVSMSLAVVIGWVAVLALRPPAPALV